MLVQDTEQRLQSRFGVGLGIFEHPRLCTVEALERIAVCICLHLSVSVDITKKDASFHMGEGLLRVYQSSENITLNFYTYSTVL